MPEAGCQQPLNKIVRALWDLGPTEGAEGERSVISEGAEDDGLCLGGSLACHDRRSDHAAES